MKFLSSSSLVIFIAYDRSSNVLGNHRVNDEEEAEETTLKLEEMVDELLEEVDSLKRSIHGNVQKRRMDFCPHQFHLNPQSTDHMTFLKQFKPCGYYQKHCSNQFSDWFDSETIVGTVKRNTCYPGYGEDDLDRHEGIYLVEFDTGLDETTYEAYIEMGQDDLINDINKGTWLSPFEDDFTTTTMPLGETCVETFVRFPDHWGSILGSDYNYMGGCGPGWVHVGSGYDCVKHDVCSFFKSYALEEQAVGYCKDIDCGDEAAQAVVNCYNAAGPVICSEDEERENPDFYGTMNPVGARIRGQKRECTLRTNWEKNQGMPWMRKANGAFCTSPDDCISHRCEAGNVCMAQLANGERCNEHSDCLSGNCGNGSGWNPFNWKCRPNSPTLNPSTSSMPSVAPSEQPSTNAPSSTPTGSSLPSNEPSVAPTSTPLLSPTGSSL